MLQRAELEMLVEFAGRNDAAGSSGETEVGVLLPGQKTYRIPVLCRGNGPRIFIGL